MRKPDKSAAGKTAIPQRGGNSLEWALGNSFDGAEPNHGTPCVWPWVSLTLQPPLATARTAPMLAFELFVGVPNGHLQQAIDLGGLEGGSVQLTVTNPARQSSPAGSSWLGRDKGFAPAQQLQVEESRSAELAKAWLRRFGTHDHLIGVVERQLALLRAHGLIGKVARTYRYVVTLKG